MTITFTVGSLFAGIGGLDLGLERAGMEVRWQVENDPYCQKVLEKHWPEVKRYGDIKEIKEGELEEVDLICGGFPCQPVSIVGLRKGEDDVRWLWPEFNRILRQIKPKWALVENVPGLLSADSGRLFGGILRDLAENGYDAEWFMLSACSLGFTHTRERLFLVAYSTRGRRDGRRQIRPASEILESVRCSTKQRGEGAAESCPVGVAHGVPSRVDRLRGLGNAVVPQVAEYIGRLILV